MTVKEAKDRLQDLIRDLDQFDDEETFGIDVVERLCDNDYGMYIQGPDPEEQDDDYRVVWLCIN